jgi:hypothetical protein
LINNFDDRSHANLLIDHWFLDQYSLINILFFFLPVREIIVKNLILMEKDSSLTNQIDCRVLYLDLIYKTIIQNKLI